MNGKLLLSDKVNSKNYKADVLNLPKNNIILINIKTENQIYTQKIVVN